jgi:hypothetical protein
MGVSFKDRNAALGASELLVAAALSTAPAQPAMCGSCEKPAAEDRDGALVVSVCNSLVAAIPVTPGKKPGTAPSSSKTPLCSDCAQTVCKAQHAAGCAEVRPISVLLVVDLSLLVYKLCR